MKSTTIFSFLFIFFCLHSCAQKNETDLKLKNIYEITKDDVNESIEKYGLKGKVKTVVQKTYRTAKDSVIDFSKYTLVDLNDEHQYFNLAEMDNDCKVNFDKLGKVTDRISHGDRFAAKSVTTDTLYYDGKNQLERKRSYLEAGERGYFTETTFEYDKNGHLVKQFSGHSQIWHYSYPDGKNQVRIVHYDDKDFGFDNVYTYNKFGQKIEQQDYTEDKTPGNRTVYEYGDNGEIKKETSYRLDGSKQDYYKHKFEEEFKVYQLYDKDRNWTTRIIVNPDDMKLTIIKRKFDYYF